MIEANKSAKYWQADAIAECLNVSPETCGELWNKCVPLYDKLPKGECPGEITYDLVNYGWKLLSDEAKNDVNKALAEIQ